MVGTSLAGTDLNPNLWPQGTTNVVGGGSTFAAPLMDYLSTNFQVPVPGRFLPPIMPANFG
jgi:hypothetical protein